jgi:predicted negative regulator of RcsB-dependent stress response
LALALSARAATPATGQLDASPTLFTVMAAINAVGFDADINSPNNHPLRQAIQAEIAKKNVPSLVPLKAFFEKHRYRNNSTQELSQYISFALTAGPPPSFAIQIREMEIPPDVLPLRELSPLLAKFYEEAGIQDLWNRSQRGIDQYLQRYHEPVINTILECNGYLRQPTTGFRGRHFQVFVELQAPPNQIQTRSYGNEFTIVVAPSPEPRIFEIRDAYLSFLLDPLATREREVLDRKHGLADHAQRISSKVLDDMYKNDFLLLTTKSLVKAVEARMDKKPEYAQQSLLEGFILTPYFYEKLISYEKQEATMMVYYKEMVAAIDLVKEDRRLSKVEFLSEPPHKSPVEIPATGAQKMLEDAERLYENQDLDKAKQLFLDVLQQTDQKPLQAKAYYGLARISLQSKDPESAERLFLKSLDTEPDPWVKGWALVYLGRLSLAAKEPDQAAEYFQKALAVEGASEKARTQAQQGIEQTKH